LLTEHVVSDLLFVVVIGSAVGVAHVGWLVDPEDVGVVVPAVGVVD
jgi:hypothetical protein